MEGVIPQASRGNKCGISRGGGRLIRPGGVDKMPRLVREKLPHPPSMAMVVADEGRQLRDGGW